MNTIPKLSIPLLVTLFCTTTASLSLGGTLLGRLRHWRNLAHAKLDRSTVLTTSTEDRHKYFHGPYKGEWNFELTSDVLQDSNVFGDSDARSDTHWDNAFGAKYDWWLSEDLGLIVSPSFQLSSAHFNRHGELNNSGLGGGLTLSVADKLPLDVEIGYAWLASYEGLWDQHALTTRDLTINFTKTHYLQKSADGKPNEDGPFLTWEFGGGLLTASEASEKGSHLDAGLTYEVPLTEAFTLATSVGLGYTDFQEASNQWLGQASLEISYQPWSGKDHSIVLGVNYARTDSSEGADRYNQWTVSLGVHLAWSKEGFLP